MEAKPGVLPHFHSGRINVSPGRVVRRALLLAGLLIISVPATAMANNWLGFVAGSDRTVTFNSCNQTSQMHAVAHDNDSHDIAVTDINTTWAHACTIVEVIINDLDYGNTNWFGAYECHNWNSTRTRCINTGHVHINLFYGPYSYNQALSLMCEEVGHSVGLDHRPSDDTTSCMSQNFTSLHLDNHDKGLLNSHY
jgi:hypothetical protein